MWKIAPALALGNASCSSPLRPRPHALLFAELLAEAGLPREPSTSFPAPAPSSAAAMAEHQGIDKISFTGETETGKAILRRRRRNVKRVSMELGGKSPNVVFADADSMRREGAINAIFTARGSSSRAGSRLLVEESIP